MMCWCATVRATPYSTVLYCTVDVSAPKLSTIKYLECENHVSEEFFFVVSTVSILSSLPYWPLGPRADELITHWVMIADELTSHLSVSPIGYGGAAVQWRYTTRRDQDKETSTRSREATAPARAARPSGISIPSRALHLRDARELSR